MQGRNLFNDTVTVPAGGCNSGPSGNGLDMTQQHREECCAYDKLTLHGLHEDTTDCLQLKRLGSVSMCQCALRQSLRRHSRVGDEVYGVKICLKCSLKITILIIHRPHFVQGIRYIIGPGLNHRPTILFLLSSLLCVPLSLRSSGDFNRLLDAVGLARVNLLARLGDLLEDDLVGQGGDDLGGLVLEGDVVALDT